LIETEHYRRTNGRQYDVTSDGQRFLMIKQGDASARIVVVENWHQELKRLVPVP